MQLTQLIFHSLDWMSPEAAVLMQLIWVIISLIETHYFLR